MERKNVKSTNVASVGYDPAKKTLEVEFHGYAVYQYFGVPKEIYDKFLTSNSKGQYFNSKIKNVFEYKKV